MSRQNKVTLDDPNLQGLINAFKNIPSIKVGVLQAKDTRSKVTGGGREKKASTSPQTKATLTNAEIGAKHEFGLDGLPVRSFLRIPIQNHLKKRMAKKSKTGGRAALDRETIKEVIKQKDLNAYMRKIAILAEAIVQDAFSSGGFGVWPESNMNFKHNEQTLVETTQLRRSISSELVKGKND